MANICMTSIRITGEKEKIEPMWQEFEKVMDNDKDMWLGSLLIHAGKTPGECGISCRGNVVGSDYSPGCISIDTDTAWTPMLGVFKVFADKFCGEGEYNMLYHAEEAGCDIFTTNDPDYEGSWVIDVWEDCGPFQEGYYEILSDGEANAKLSELLCISPGTEKTQTLADKAMEEYELSVHQYEYAGIDDYN